MRSVLLVLVSALALMAPAHAQDSSTGRNLQVTPSGKRLALVIGNDNYQKVNKLQKAGSDATTMARELRSAGFEVTLQRDLNYLDMVNAIDVFTGRITGGDVVVVFFAGHGVQIKTGSYLLPTDISANSESQVEKTSYGVADLTDKLAEAKASFALVMVDACRDNPLKSNGRAIGGSRGLSAIEPPKGQMVVYSASKGQQALDKLSDTDNNPNGIFTREFIKRMKKPGVKIQDLMIEVQDSVETLAQSVSHEQRPAIYNESRGNFYFFGPTTVQVQGSQSGNQSPDPETQVWIAAERANSTAGYQAYLDAYPKGRYAVAAKISLAAVQRIQEQPKDSNRANTAPQRLQSEQREIAASESAKGPQPGQSFKDCADCPEMVVLPAGSFQMGGKSGDELPVHTVTIARAFAMGKTEVTQAQWQAVMGNNPSNFKQCGADCPVETVSWNDAQKFIQKLNAKTGKQYRLPSESEWEYACRAGGRHEYCGGDNINAVAWYGNDGSPGGNSSQITHRVATKQANAFGLSDMSGNVSEWTQDYYHDNYSGAPSDGSAWVTGGEQKLRVLRGGSWSHDPAFVRLAYRSRSTTLGVRNLRGFRLARIAP